MWSTGNCARNWNFTIQTNRIWTTENISWRIRRSNGSTNLDQKSRPRNNQQRRKERSCWIIDFIVQANHRIKLKESENKDKYLDLTRVLIKLWNINVTMIQIVIGALATVTKGLIKGLEYLDISEDEWRPSKW